MAAISVSDAGGRLCRVPAANPEYDSATGSRNPGRPITCTKSKLDDGHPSHEIPRNGRAESLEIAETVESRNLNAV